ncbi:hypothetical protein [Methanosarcina siciliae]|uniref:hypothetical protein n=1 Tax=Methanosarcina siciliae TaxID=38027 RepID=UPI0012E044CF|nr:hypothetical protein [Methanosarcina siciliae]
MSTKTEGFKELLKDPEVQECLKDIIRNCLHESDIFIRLDLIEENLGADESHCVGRDLAFEKGISEYDEEREPLPKILERVAKIYKEIDSIQCAGGAEQILEVNTLSDVRARLLVEKLESMTPRIGVRYMTSKEVGEFIQTEIAEEFRYKGKSREVRNDLMSYAVKKFPDKVRLGQSKYGKKPLRIELIEV